MSVRVEGNDHFATIHIDGELDAALAEEARQVFDELTQNIKGDVVVDLSKCEFLDSAGIGAIVFLYKRICCVGYNMSICGAHGLPYDILKLLRLDGIMKIEPLKEKVAAD